MTFFGKLYFEETEDKELPTEFSIQSMEEVAYLEVKCKNNILWKIVQRK